MANYFSLTLDTLAPVIRGFHINSGAAVTTNRVVTLTIDCDDAAAMKIWGIDGVASEAAASWETFAATKQVTLPDGDGSKTIYVKVRDAVYNASAAASDSITLSTSLPTINITRS